METGSIRTAAEAFASTLAAQQAFNVLSFLNLVDYLNPYDGCVANNSIFDYIIVGAGTSGCVLGDRLSEDSDVKVLVIEAGGNWQLEHGLPSLRLYTKRSHSDWNFTASYDANYAKCHQTGKFMPTVAKVLGGSSSLNAMVYTQGEDRDYNQWAKLSGEVSWRFPNVLRLFKKAERFNDDALQNSADSVYHGFNGKVGLTKDYSPITNKYLQAFGAVGHKIVQDINARNRLGFSRTSFYIADNIRQSSAYAYLYPVRNRTNLVVLKHTQVTKILFDEEKNAIGVEAVVLKKKLKYVFKVRREVVLAAGVFNTPKLLQLSGIGPKKVLKKCGIPVLVNSPGVGVNYQNHIGVTLVHAMENTSKSYDASNYDPHNFPAPTFVGSASINSSDTYTDYQTLSVVVSITPAVAILQHQSFLFRYNLSLVDQWVRRSMGKEMLVTILLNAKPKSRGVVKLRSADPFDDPIIDAGYFSNDEDVTDMIKYVQDYLRVKESLYFKNVGATFVDVCENCAREVAGSDEYWRCYVLCTMIPMEHHSGTAALGPVVGGRLRVHGVRNLRVADASIIPEILAGAVNFPTLMIGENAAELIKADWAAK